VKSWASPTTSAKPSNKAHFSAGQKLPTQGTVFISVNDQDKPHVAEVAKRFFELGFKNS